MFATLYTRKWQDETATLQVKGKCQDEEGVLHNFSWRCWSCGKPPTRGPKLQQLVLYLEVKSESWHIVGWESNGLFSWKYIKTARKSLFVKKKCKINCNMICTLWFSWNLNKVTFEHCTQLRCKRSVYLHLDRDVLCPVSYPLPTQIRAEIGWGSVLWTLGAKGLRPPLF